MQIGTLTQDAEGVVQWKIQGFTSLDVNGRYGYWSPDFSCAGGKWWLWMPGVCPEVGRSGQRIELILVRRTSVGPRTLDVEYTFSVKDRDGHRQGEKRNRMEFEGLHDRSPRIGIELEERRMSDLVPGDTLTVLCQLEGIDPTREAAQLKEERQQESGELASVRRELAENQSELVRLRRLNEELNLKITDLEADRDNEQKLLQTKNNSQLKKELEQKSADLDCVKRELGNKQFELNKWKRLYEESILKTIDTEISRENLQSLPTSGTQSPLTSVTETCDFAHNFNRFLEEKTDVTFVLEALNGKKEFFAHRFVLARKSSYFANEFREKQRNEEEQLILLENINPKAFKDMIRYCYDWEPCFRTTEETCALLEVAFQFKVASLVNVCQAFLREARIEPGNVLSILFVSQKTGDKSLAEICNMFLQDKTREVIESHELCNVTPLMVHTILDLPKLSLCSEYELIKWVFDWAKIKCQENDSICDSAREYLEKLLQDMNFLALTFEEFAMLCKNNLEFFSPAEFQSISMNIASPGTMEMPDWFDKDLRLRTYTGVKE